MKLYSWIPESTCVDWNNIELSEIFKQITFLEDEEINDETKWTHQDLNEFSWQQYCIFAFSDVGDSEFSDSDSIRTLISNPDGLTAVTISPTQIDLEWNDNSADEDGYSIERSQGSEVTWQVINVTDSDDNHYMDESLESSTRYAYRIRTQIDVEYSSYSDEITAITENAPSIIIDVDS